MTIKITAQKAWADGDFVYALDERVEGTFPIRIVRESDWQGIIEVLQAMEAGKYDDAEAALDILQGRT